MAGDVWQGFRVCQMNPWCASWKWPNRVGLSVKP